MFKRKQKPAAPPNFIDLRNPPKKPGKPSQPATFSDIHPHYSPGKLLQLPRYVQYSLLGAVTLLVIVLVVGLGHHAKDPVPKIIRENSKLAIYYPDQSKLPDGYTLDEKSFSAGNQAILYTVTYGNGQRISFTLQAKPSSQSLQVFYAKQIPLHTTLHTSNGTATIGALGNQIIASLPTDKNTWILLTAPGGINQNALHQVLRSLKQ
jgi:hypothetical protein